MSELQQLWLSYWTEFYGFLEEKNTIIEPKPAAIHQAMRFSDGSMFEWSAHLVNKGQRFGVGLTTKNKHTKANFDTLYELREQIEAEIGEPLCWERHDDRVMSFIRLYGVGDPWDESDWPRQHAWMLEKLLLFHRVFQPRIDVLKEHYRRRG
jgi:hypothetical protein